MSLPFWNRLSTRLSLLILVIVLVLAGATAFLVSRGFNLLSTGATEALSARGIEATSELSNILTSTLINLVAVFLLTLVGATVFSRTLLTEPITSLVEATQEIAAGNLGVTLPVTSNSELGMLASAFNQMSTNLSARTQDLVAANEALKQSEAQLEQRVQARTSELTALLELSNSTALTLELYPLLESIMDKLAGVIDYASVSIYEADLNHSLRLLTSRGEQPALLPASAVSDVEVCFSELDERHQLHIPVMMRQQVIGRLVIEHADAGMFTPERIRVASAFASQVGVALENAKLYDQVHEKAAYEERQHLARELHDSVSQALYSIVLGTHAARKQLKNPEQAEKALVYVQNLAEAGLAEMRALIFELRPEILEQEGLVAALRKQTEALEVRHQLSTEFMADAEPELPFASKQALFRVAQEALHNIVKHARAEKVALSLTVAPKAVQLSVRDDGIGFNANTDYPGHLGLKSMRERVSALGGTLHLDSRTNKGTLLTVEIPIRVPRDPHETSQAGEA